MKRDNIEILKETLQILDLGKFEANGNTVELQLSKERMEVSHVLLPADVVDICGRNVMKATTSGTFRCGCAKQDS